jgi:RIO kinase 1
VTKDDEFVDDFEHEIDVKSMHGEGGISTEWMDQPKMKKMFQEIEHRLQGVLGTGRYDWVDRRVFDQVFDQSTLLSIYKLMRHGAIDTVEFPIASGKEAHVFYATSIDGPRAVKIFHTSNAVFKGLTKYIEGDPRFGGLKRRHRELVTIWVRKEHRNLKRLENSGLRVPAAFEVNRNVLVMEYLGSDSGPSPRLRDIKIEDPDTIFNDLVNFMKASWKDADLVHADLSEYNVLWHNDEPWIIDVGQAVKSAHPNAQEFLIRDVRNICNWASKKGVETNFEETLLGILEG